MITKKRNISAIVVMLVFLLTATLAAPAEAKKKKKKKIQESFTVTALPFPNLSSSTGTERRSCFAGAEGVHWGQEGFEAPGSGELRLYIEGFTLDWDLELTLADGIRLYSVNDQVTGGAAAEEEIVAKLKKGDAVSLAACNWVSPQPEIEVHYEYVYKA